MRVRTNSGQMTVQPMPVWPARARSLARASVRATTACLVAKYDAMPGPVTSPAADAVFTMWPSPCSMKRGRNDGDAVGDAEQVDLDDPPEPVDADRPRLAAGEHAGVVADDVDGAEAVDGGGGEGVDGGRVAHVGRHRQRLGPSPASDAAAFSSASTSTSARTTRMPSAANAPARAKPMPDAPPVTTRRLPRRSCMRFGS